MPLNCSAKIHWKSGNPLEHSTEQVSSHWKLPLHIHLNNPLRLQLDVMWRDVTSSDEMRCDATLRDTMRRSGGRYAALSTSGDRLQHDNTFCAENGDGYEISVPKRGHPPMKRVSNICTPKGAPPNAVMFVMEHTLEQITLKARIEAVVHTCTSHPCTAAVIRRRSCGAGHATARRDVDHAEHDPLFFVVVFVFLIYHVHYLCNLSLYTYIYIYAYIHSFIFHVISVDHAEHDPGRDVGGDQAGPRTGCLRHVSCLRSP